MSYMLYKNLCFHSCSSDLFFAKYTYGYTERTVLMKYRSENNFVWTKSE